MLGYFVTRTYNLTINPIFTDEAIYIRWSQIGLSDPEWRFIALTDGKPPLYHWFLIGLMATGIFADPLVEGRVVSVMAGLASLVLIVVATTILTGKKWIGWLAGLLYVVSPFMLVYDRLAIVDSLLTTTSLAVFTFALLLVKTRRLDSALLLGGSVGAAMLTKASGLIFLLMSPAMVILGNWTRKTWRNELLKYSFLLLVAGAISQMIYGILRLSQFFYRIEQKNSEFIISFSQFLQAPFEMTKGNLESLLSWQIGYLSLPVVVIILLGLLNRQFWCEKLVLLAYTFAPMFMIASFNKIIFPRFLLFSNPYLLILAAISFYQLSHRLKDFRLKAALLVVTCLLPGLATFHWITNPAIANIPQADRDQYYDSWPAGHGIVETVTYLREQAQKQPIFIGTQGTFGLMPYALEIYLVDNPNVEIKSYWPVDVVPEEVIEASKLKPTYFIYNELEDIPEQSELELVLEFRKTRLDEVRHMRLFKVNAPID